jgi:predicted amidohydrolase
MYLYAHFAIDVYILKRGGDMRICFVSRDSIYTQQKDLVEAEADLIVGGFKSVGEVSYERELKEETDYFERLALLSKTTNSVVICGCITDTKGFKRKSAVVAENGRLLGVSDMLNVVDGDGNSGAALKVYDTKAGKIGVVVGEDLYFPELLRTLAVCGCDIITCITDQPPRPVEGILLRAAAFSYGVPVCLCGKGYSLIADESGAQAFSSPKSPVEYSFENKRAYHLVETRVRGFYRPDEKDF